MSSLPLQVDAELRDHGIAVNKGLPLSMSPWRDAATGRDYIYVGVNGAPSLIVQVDAKSGACRSFEMPQPCGCPWTMAFTMEGHLIVSSVTGHLCRIDPSTGRSWIAASSGNWAWCVERASDGMFYMGTHPKSQMFRYDPVSEKLDDMGPISETQSALRGIQDGRDGYIYCLVGFSASQVIAYQLASGHKHAVLPESEAVGGQHWMGRGRDGKVYVWTVRKNVYRLEHGEAFFEKELTKKSGENFPEFLISYFSPTLPDGRPVRRVDPDALQIGEGAKAKIIPVKYEVTGGPIWHLGAGPKEGVYASTCMPLYLLRYVPKTDKLENLGRGGPDNGEAYSFGHCDGKLYYATYPDAYLMSYDPAKPVHKDPPGKMKWKSNPKVITLLGKGHGRPRAMFIDSKKRVWVGGPAEYGGRHGGLGCYDIGRKKYRNNPVVIPDQSVYALTADDAGKIVYGGTTIGRGSGMESVTPEAHLFAWDARKQKLLWQHVPIPGMTGVLNLIYHDGKLYGTTGNNFSFFCFDPKMRTLDYNIASEISACREQSMCVGPDGNIYGITWMSLFRWRPREGKIEAIYRCVGDDAKKYDGGSLFWRGAVIIDGRMYFSSGAKVVSLRLPLEDPVNA